MNNRKLHLYRYPNQPNARLSSAAKGVIRYALVNMSKSYTPNGRKEVARRLRQMADGQLNVANGRGLQ